MQMKRKNVSDDDSSDNDEIQETIKDEETDSKNVPKSNKKKFKNKHLYRQPTTDELNQLRETENLFNSNLFRLQIEEVLKEVKIRPKTTDRIKTWIEAFNRHLNTLEDGEEHLLSHQDWLKDQNIHIPITQSPKEVNGTFKFQKCSPATVIGSYELDCSISSKLAIDLQILIPASVFTKSDSINHRYHRKRAIYLAILANHILKSSIVSQVQYKFLHGCEWKPVLTIKPEGKLNNQVDIIIHLACEESTFKAARFHVQRNNVREGWYFSNAGEDKTAESPTPFYNSAILYDLTSSSNNEYLHSVLSESVNLKQSITLLKIWLRQRNLQVSGFVISMFVAYLVHTRRINDLMSSYQIARNVWISLGNSEWDTKGVSLFSSQGTDSPTLEEFLSEFPVVFVDRGGFYNICWRMSLGTYHALRSESKIAVAMLDNHDVNSFIPLFMTPFKFQLQFDNIVRFQNIPSLKNSVKKRISKAQLLDYAVDEDYLVLKTITDTMRKGLGERVELLLENDVSENEYSWPVSTSIEEAKKTIFNERKIAIGLKLNQQEALNVLDKGPPANLPEAEKFRAFWGEKSELRRFQDGSITEACVWENDGTMEKRRLIVRKIINYLLKLKYGIDKNVFYIADQLELVLHSKLHPVNFDYGTGEEATLQAINTFDSLRKQIRTLTELPLDIISIYGVSPVFSYTEPLPPVPTVPCNKPKLRAACCLVSDNPSHTSSPPYTPTLQAVVELGHSGKWPGELEAFKRLKAAFHIHLADSVMKQCTLPAHAYPDHLDILKDGLVFRLTLAHNKQRALMKRAVDEDGVTKYRDTEESLDLEYRTVHLPRLRGALHGLHQKYPSFGPAVCLGKRWLSSHLLDESSVPGVVVEMMMASCFLQPEPYQPPVQPLQAFQRFLALAANTDWHVHPLILNFNGELERESITEVEKKFATMRGNLPALFVATGYEGDKPSAWTRRAPTVQILVRMKQLAATSLHYLQKNLLHDCCSNVMDIFKPSLEGYNVLIHLDRSVLPLYETRAGALPQRKITHNNPTNNDSRVIPVVNYDPVQNYLAELRAAYDEFALFFHDSYGGAVIAVLWRPSVSDDRQFKISCVSGRKPGSDGKLVLNMDALLEDFKLLGRGLVTRVATLS